MFGDDHNEDALAAAEEGKASSSVTKGKETAASEATTGSRYLVKLLVCVVGLQASYLTWGVLQVCITGLDWRVPHRLEHDPF